MRGRGRYVYDFDEPSEGGRELLGGKGIGLAEMTQLGIPVPAGFTITTDACRAYMIARGEELPDGLPGEIDEHIDALERRSGKRFGDPRDPLLVSVRSGAAISMPGMMDTILNLGLNDDAVEGLAATTGNARFAYDSYRRLIQMYGEVVTGIDGHRFEQALGDLKAARGVQQDVELGDDDLRELVATFKRIYEDETGSPFPQDARGQLAQAVRAVFESWNTPRAQVYRRAHRIPDDLGTAVNVVQMVFGNKGEGSGTGVAFTRDPSTGEQGLYGEFLADAQGEDVVAGIRTPEPIEAMQKRLPEAFGQLTDTMQRLEQHYRDMQDIEFTVEEGRLFLLQTRSAKRTAAAALKAAVSMVEEGLISREDAVVRIDPAQLDQLLHPMIDPKAELEVAARGLNASPGAACGAVVLDADTAEERGKAGESVILVRWETTPDDIHGLLQAGGILTAHGGMTSHAAVVARGMGKPCVAGCEGLTIDLDARTLVIGGHGLAEGDVITIDGGTGRVVVGAVDLVPPQINEDFETILGWADELRRLKVRANADTPEDAAKAREFGAQGIGLCRTEHMFMAEDRLPVVREMIMAAGEDERRSALDRLLPHQQSDFEGIFEAMAGLPVTIRLLDPPLHEFLPPLEEARDERLRERIKALQESNPMLGTRGCRLGLLWPEIYEMQVRAIVRAAAAVEERTGEAPLVEIMHPLVGFAEELKRLRELTVETAREENDEVEYLCGTMIELPRACIRADEIAEHADFFSFGTNDLTQTTLGFSRDDAEGKFLTRYLEDGVLRRNPFETLDQSGVGDLMRIGVERGRGVKDDLKLGICGEHGGEPDSVAFCHGLGLDYVSCSPYRVPVARLAAAQAALAEAGVEAVTAGG
ncbi:MAG TPA: pyruvate, phosphate dikinase [Gaiellaceae bacterium]|nr:pyruvate, phosphate dikinase [Gaiellaceae bacterium]